MSKLSERLRHYQKCDTPTQDFTLKEAADRIDELEKAFKHVGELIDVATERPSIEIPDYLKQIGDIIRKTNPWKG